MKKIGSLLCVLILCFSCDKENDAPTPSKKELLAGTSQKSWLLHSTTPDEPCASSADNTWIFFADGVFEYNHGTVTQDDGNNCGDLVNLIGTWEFLTNETEIKVVGLYEKGNPANSFNVVILSGKLQELNNDKMLIVETDTATNTDFTAEFRKK